MDGHWYYQAIDTGLAVKRKDCDPDLPLSMDPKRIFKASVADNKDWNSFQPVAVVDRCVNFWTINTCGRRTHDDTQICTYMQHVGHLTVLLFVVCVTCCNLQWLTRL
jgi:hypothetical protein